MCNVSCMSRARLSTVSRAASGLKLHTIRDHNRGRSSMSVRHLRLTCDSLTHPRLEMSGGSVIAHISNMIMRTSSGRCSMNMVQVRHLAGDVFNVSELVHGALCAGGSVLVSVRQKHEDGVRSLMMVRGKPCH